MISGKPFMPLFKKIPKKSLLHAKLFKETIVFSGGSYCMAEARSGRLMPL